MMTNPFEFMASVVPFLTLPYVYYHNFVSGMIGDLFGGFGGADQNDSESKNDE